MRTNDRSKRSLLACCTASLALLVAAPALAAGVTPADATATQKKEATDHFTAGKHALESKNSEKAVRRAPGVARRRRQPQRAPRAGPRAARLGAPSDAFAEYGRVIESATQLAAKEERYAKTAEAATTERTELEPKLAFVVVTLAHAPADAVLKVGGRTVSASEAVAPVIVPAGAVDVVLSDASGKELVRQTVEAAVGQKTPVALDAQPPPPPAPPGKPDPDDKPPSDARNPVDTTPSAGAGKLRPYAYVAGGVGVAGLAVFTIFGLMDNSTYSGLQGSCPNNHCPASKQGDIDNGRTQQTIANVGLIVGAVGVAAGATLFVLSLPKSSPVQSTGLVVGPGYLGVRGSL